MHLGVLTVREFASHSEDFNFSKQIPMFTERVRTVFRMGFFSAFNRPGQFTGFDPGVGDGNFGHASTRQNNPRSIQGNLRVSF
jgi:hypothetical protein